MKALELIHISDFEHYIFYGEKKLEGEVIYKDGVYNFDLINWNYVSKMNNGYWNYSQAINQLLNDGHKNCEAVAFVIQKVLGLKIDYICHEDDTLYMEVK